MSNGLFNTSKLIPIIAVAGIGREIGLIDENLFSSFILVAIVSIIVGPIAGKYMLAISDNN